MTVTHCRTVERESFLKLCTEYYRDQKQFYRDDFILFVHPCRYNFLRVYVNYVKCAVIVNTNTSCLILLHYTTNSKSI